MSPSTKGRTSAQDVITPIAQAPPAPEVRLAVGLVQAADQLDAGMSLKPRLDGRGVAVRQEIDHGAGDANGATLRLSANQHRGWIAPQRLGQRIVEIAAGEADVAEHAVVERGQHDKVTAVAPCRYDTPAETRGSRLESSESLGEWKRKGRYRGRHGSVPCSVPCRRGGKSRPPAHVGSPNTPWMDRTVLYSQISIDKKNECF